jgi:hypothetical protein
VSDVATLLRAIVDLIWAGVAGTALWVFKDDIRLLLRRVRKAKYKDLELELDALQQAAEQAKEVPALPAGKPAELPATTETSAPVEVSSERQVQALEPAPPPAASPKYGVVLLAAEIERELRHYLAVTGRLQGRSFVPMARELERYELPQDLALAIRRFWEVRNKVVHGLEATDDDAVRAADAGITILGALRSLPRERNVVYHPGVDIFSDPHGKQPVAVGKAVVLETTSSDGKKKSLRVFPTTRTDYTKGVEVAWEWRGAHTWGETWYRHPDDGTIQYGWSESMEFYGRPLPPRP